MQNPPTLDIDRLRLQKKRNLIRSAIIPAPEQGVVQTQDVCLSPERGDVYVNNRVFAGLLVTFNIISS